MVIRRRFLKFLVPAVTVLAALLGLLIGLAPQKEGITVRYAVLFTTENELVTAFAVGDRLTDGASKGALGTVTAIEVSPAMGENESGVFSLPDKSRVILTITGEGAKKGSVLTVSDVPLLIGKRLSLHGRGTAYGICLWAEEVTE